MKVQKFNGIEWLVDLTIDKPLLAQVKDVVDRFRGLPEAERPDRVVVKRLGLGEVFAELLAAENLPVYLI